MSLSTRRPAAFLLLAAATASAYTWPNPKLDELESLLYDQQGYNSRGILAGALGTNCEAFNFGNTPNRSNAADWVRAVCESCVLPRRNATADPTCGLQAYHDMATHNMEDGSGGLDASIQFEQDRPEVCCSMSKTPMDAMEVGCLCA